MEIDHAIRDAGAKIEARTGRNLFAAISIGVLLGAVFIVSLAFDKQWFLLVIGVFVGFGAWELATISRTENRHVPRIPILVSSLAMLPAAYYFGYLGQILTLAGGIAFAVAWHAVQRAASRSEVTDRDVLMTSFTLAYVPFLASFAVLMTAREDGQWWTMGTMIIIASVDTGAFASGVLWGKTPLAPKISPKKTWEGLIGSAVFGATAGYLIASFMLHIDWWWGVLLGLIITGVATAGDLIESLIKRELNTKDASHFLPGHGGFLDRLDSVLPSMFVASVFAILFS